MSKTFTDQNWGGVKCTLDSKGTLTINTEELENVVIDTNSNNYVMPWDSNRNDVKSVIIKGHISFKKGSSLIGLFLNFYNCESFNGLENLDVFETINMRYMFYMYSNVPNKKLKTLDLSNWNITNVTNMAYMFSNCTNLKSIKLNDITIKNYIGLN